MRRLRNAFLTVPEAAYIAGASPAGVRFHDPFISCWMAKGMRDVDPPVPLGLVLCLTPLKCRRPPEVELR
jgi:hypothetical protein